MLCASPVPSSCGERDTRKNSGEQAVQQKTTINTTDIERERERERESIDKSIKRPASYVSFTEILV